ncbi:hypothetical protein AB0N31_35925 [Streptomyces sp. NPDC051051]|uniref:hypothetical protein n=1 Tax=Streptomyces sp. NPDC051051 TaxID=3155666 RepID=UPI003443A65E
MTAFALSVARHNDELGHRALFASFESGTDTIMRNLVATTSVNTDRPLSINKGRRARIERAREAMEQSRLQLWSRALKTGSWPFKNLMEQLTAQPDLPSSSWTDTDRPSTANPPKGQRSPRCNSSPSNATSPSW